MTRQNNNGVRKLCGCERKQWPKCAHPWHFNYTPRGGKAWRFSLDAEVGRPLKGKTEADTLAADIRAAINAGTYVRAAERRRQAEAAAAAEAPAATTAFQAFATIYVERVSQARERNKSWKNDQHMLNRIAAFALPDGSTLGDKPIVAITEDDLEAVVQQLRATGRAVSTRNQYVQVIKKSFRWATKKGYLARNPISEDSILKRGKHAQRHRRLTPDVVDAEGTLLQPGEERRLLAVAGVRLQWLIVAALETACRAGELLALQWADVNTHRHELTIRAETAKDAERRTLPISPRLASVLEMARTDPAGKEYPADKYVFGECGERVKKIKRSWETAVLKAAGHTPEWGTSNKLSPASRAALKSVDLHFHDLRHEGASRMLEAGWPLHHIQTMLGHASLEQTSTYLNVEKSGLLDSMRRFGVPAGIRCNPVAISEAETAAAASESREDNGGKMLIN